MSLAVGAGWSATGASVRGADHIRLGLPNQDALVWEVGEAGTVVAVADGHGSPRCFRSATGARLAAGVARRVLTSFLAGAASPDRVAHEVTAGWRRAVADDAAADPLRDEETLPAWGRPAGTDPEDVLLAYGTTLLGVAARGDEAFLFQIGDGDVLVVGGGDGVRRPIPRDDRLVGNETTSLSSSGAVADFRVAAVRFEPGPTVIVVCSDGYTNSFASTEGFLQVAPDFLSMVRRDGLSLIETNLEAWLRQHSDEGSGDDVTVGLLIRQARP